LISSEPTLGRMGAVIAPRIRSDNAHELVAKGTDSARQNDQTSALNKESIHRSHAKTPAGDAPSQPEQYLPPPKSASIEGITSSSLTMMGLTPDTDTIKQRVPIIVAPGREALASPVAKAIVTVRATLEDDPEQIARRLVSGNSEAHWILYSGVADLSAVRTWANRLSRHWQITGPIQIRHDRALPIDAVEFRLVETP
jgi:hypothetical protein